jgi:hypothetical protein
VIQAEYVLADKSFRRSMNVRRRDDCFFHVLTSFNGAADQSASNGPPIHGLRLLF